MKRLLALAAMTVFAGGYLACLAEPETPQSAVAADTERPDGGTPALDLNDVSILLPLPRTAAERSAMLSLSAAGANGALLDRPTYESLPHLDTNVHQGSPTPPFGAAPYEAMSVTAIRFDPCGPAAAAGAPCEPQVRLVVQAVLGRPETWYEVHDAGLHLIYTVDAAEWPSVVGGLRDLKRIAGDRSAGALDIHPVIKSEGLDGAFASALNRLVLDHVGQGRLERVALRSSLFAAVWTFRARNRMADGGFPVDDPIARLDGGGAESLSGSNRILPAMAEDDVTPLLVNGSPDDAGAAVYADAIGASLAADNPARTDLHTRDCVTCHIATRARESAEAVRPFDESTRPERFLAPGFDIHRTAATGRDPLVQIAFGYFKTESAINQRTINESAQVAAALNASGD